jgi:LEA14-like dessication related protein
MSVQIAKGSEHRSQILQASSQQVVDLPELEQLKAANAKTTRTERKTRFMDTSMIRWENHSSEDVRLFLSRPPALVKTRH